MKELQRIYDSLRIKRNKSLTIYLLLNISIIVLTSIVIVLNLYMVRMNRASSETKWIFIALSVLTSVSAAVGSFMSLMVYRKKSKNLRDKQRKIVEELDKFKLGTDEYQLNEKEETLIRKVNEILRREQ